jgi:AAA+ ATPase superfamily predicted ATPase
MNPFSYGTVVKEPYFFNRKEEIRRIVSTLGGGNNLVLYAPRRYGKTSVVMHAIESLTALGFTCIYFDFMAVYSRESFIEAFSRAVLTHQNNFNKALKSFSKLVKGIRPKLSFDQSGTPEFSLDFSATDITDQSLGSVIDLPEKLADGKRKFIIIMDEFQDIDKLDGENFEKLLRSKIQHHTNVNYLFLGSRTHILNDMFTNKSRAFYNSAAAMHLAPLPENETVEFLINRFSLSNIKINESAASRLIEQAGNIPYYIQFLASEVWQYCINRIETVSDEIISVSAGKILDLKSDYYFELFDRRTSYQKKLLKALAMDSQNVFSAEYASKFRLSVASTTQKALSGLIHAGIIEKYQNYYMFDDPFFKKYILRLPA